MWVIYFYFVDILGDKEYDVNDEEGDYLVHKTRTPSEPLSLRGFLLEREDYNEHNHKTIHTQ